MKAFAVALQLNCNKNKHAALTGACTYRKMHFLLNDVHNEAIFVYNVKHRQCLQRIVIYFSIDPLGIPVVVQYVYCQQTWRSLAYVFSPKYDDYTIFILQHKQLINEDETLVFSLLSKDCRCFSVHLSVQKMLDSVRHILILLADEAMKFPGQKSVLHSSRFDQVTRTFYPCAEH